MIGWVFVAGTVERARLARTLHDYIGTEGISVKIMLTRGHISYSASLMLARSKLQRAQLGLTQGFVKSFYVSSTDGMIHGKEQQFHV